MQQGMQGMQGLQPMQQMGPGWGKSPMTPMAPGSQCLGGARLLDDMKIGWSRSSAPEMAGLILNMMGFLGLVDWSSNFEPYPSYPNLPNGRWEHVEPLVGS